MIPPQLQRRVGCPRGGIEPTPFRLTPADQSINVDINTLSAHAGYRDLDEGFLRASEPVVVTLLQFVGVRR
jgi:hypothetical protein